MPVQDLPNVLEQLLDTLSRERTLMSWQIFEDRSRNVVVKLRFNGDHVAAGVSAGSFRRKAPSQVKRDQERLAKHKERASAPIPTATESCLSTSSRVISGNGPATNTRSKVIANQCEQLRGECRDSSELYDISVTSLASPCLPLHDTLLSPLATPYTPISPIRTVISAHG